MGVLFCFVLFATFMCASFFPSGFVKDPKNESVLHVGPWEDPENMIKSPGSEDRAAAAKSLQSCPTWCDPTDGSPPGSPVPGILQARTLEWVAISFSNA